MSEYFCSFVIKVAKSGGGHIDAGYGHTTATAGCDDSAGDVLSELIKAISIKFGVKKKDVHVTTFNKL